MTPAPTDLAPALAGRRPPTDDGPALRQLAVRLASAGHRCERAADLLGRTTAELRRHWRGTASVAAFAGLDVVRLRAVRTSETYAEAARVLIACANRIDEAQATWQRAAELQRQDECERAARERAMLRGAFVSPYDVDGSGLRRQARRLADEAHAETTAATTRAALQLRELATQAPVVDRVDHPRLTAADQAAGVGRGAVDAVWDSLVMVAGLSTPRLLLDRDGWREQVRQLREGAEYAAAHPREAGLAAIGWDLLQEGRYGEWAGGLLPDLAGGVVSGGALPAGRRGADLADDLAELGDEVDDLQRVHGRPGVALASTRGGPVRPAPGAEMAPRYPSVIQDLEPERQRHILDGDPPEVNGGDGGGHRAGTGKPGKSEFPPTWTDDDIIRRAMDTAMHPMRTIDKHPVRKHLLAQAEHEGVLIRVVVDSKGRIISAYPLRGPGVVRNPHLEKRK